MEYCNGGSLFNIIELPENIYGLNQTEFLLVLKHISKTIDPIALFTSTPPFKRPRPSVLTC